MASSLPTEDSWSKSVDTFGNGTYDSPSDQTSLKGEDDESREPHGESLPQDGWDESDSLEYYLSYPQEDAIKHASADLPGDTDKGLSWPNPSDKTINDTIVTDTVTDQNQVSDESEIDPDHSQLPTGQLPAARSDYFDKTVLGARG
ncbi:MAG: hypothetical protein ACWGQW_20470, partial [bacterium]